MAGPSVEPEEGSHIVRPLDLALQMRLEADVAGLVGLRAAAGVVTVVHEVAAAADTMEG